MVRPFDHFRAFGYVAYLGHDTQVNHYSGQDLVDAMSGEGVLECVTGAGNTNSRYGG